MSWGREGIGSKEGEGHIKVRREHRLEDGVSPTAKFSGKVNEGVE